MKTVKIYNEKRKGYKYIDGEEISSYQTDKVFFKRFISKSDYMYEIVLEVNEENSGKSKNQIAKDAINDKDLSDEERKNSKVLYNERIDLYYKKISTLSYRIFIDTNKFDKRDSDMLYLKEIIVSNNHECTIFLVPMYNKSYLLNENGDTMQVL